jgi:hypothetical protein
VYQWCGFKSRKGKNKNLTALKSNSNTVWFNLQTDAVVIRRFSINEAPKLIQTFFVMILENKFIFQNKANDRK